MREKVNMGSVLLAGATAIAMAVAVVGHMVALDWVGQKLRDYVRSA